MENNENSGISPKALKLFKEWGCRKVPCCHWKSNEHLIPGLQGKTDLDVLVSRSHSNEARQVLLSLGFMRFQPCTYLNYQGIEDYIGLDEDTGAILHVHLHWELLIGRKFLKEIHLPWEDAIFQSVEEYENLAVPVIKPEIELILLVIRAAVKMNLKKRLKRKGLGTDDQREYDWLLSRISQEELKEKANELLVQNLAESFSDLINNPASSQLAVLGRQFRRELPWTRSALDYYKMKLYAAGNYLSHKKFGLPKPYRRSLPEGGCVIAFFGVDGSGKSTIIRETHKWLTWKLDVYSIYFGSGDGKGSLLRWPLKVVASLRKKKRGNVLSLSEEKSKRKKKNILFRMARALWALSLAREKGKKIRDMLKARSRGMIVLCDRYPQTQFNDINDGPLLSHWSNSSLSLKRKLANWEYGVYNLANSYPPDLSIKLIIPVDLAAERKTDTPHYILEQKAGIISELKPGKQIVSVNTTGTVEESMAEIKKILWSNL